MRRSMTSFDLSSANGDGITHVWLAAHDASLEDKELDDRILEPGETITEALDALGFTRGRVHLSDGTFPDDAT